MLKIETEDPARLSGTVSPSALVELALRGLPPMFDAGKNLFCNRLKQTPAGIIREGVSQRYTLMTLMGLSTAQRAGYLAPIDVDSVLENLCTAMEWMNHGGDLGLYLWTCSLIRPDNLERIIAKVNLWAVIESYPDTRERRTMELAWLLSGLSHMRIAKVPGLPDYSDLAYQTYNLLKQNQGSQGIFGHLFDRGSYVGILRGRIGSFADQVYPIYALSKFAQAYDVPDAVRAAKQCAEAICSAQGPLGQWWWHYDSRTGRTLGKYPVYSVHQEAMGPMALFALSAVSNEDFSSPIYAGLDWIAGKNELNSDMRDQAHNLIWRSFYQSKYRDYGNNVLGLLGGANSSKGLKIKYECRPYELGWLLYAFAAQKARR